MCASSSLRACAALAAGFVTTLSALALGACYEPFELPADTADTAADTADTSVDDTTPEPDTPPADTTPSDTVVSDTTPDTTPEDTTVSDTTPADTADTRDTTDTTPTDTADTADTRDTTDTTDADTTPQCEHTTVSGEPFFLAGDSVFSFGLEDDDERLVIEVYDLDGAGYPVEGPGDFALGATEAERNYATCALCALIRTGTEVFFATEGTLRVTSFDLDANRVEATLLDATLIEVTIAPEPSYLSTPVAGGESYCLPRVPIAYEPLCASDVDCGGATPRCDLVSKRCGSCLNDLDCTAATPLCIRPSAAEGPRCQAGIDACTGDDAREQRDDGAAGATALTLGTPISGKICGDEGAESQNEADWYRIALGRDAQLGVSLTWSDDSAELRAWLVDDTLTGVGYWDIDAAPEHFELYGGALSAGTYYVLVQSVQGPPVAAVAYQVKVDEYSKPCDDDADCRFGAYTRCVTVGEASLCGECDTDLDCAGNEEPVCATADGTKLCYPTFDGCTGDDTAEPADDSANGATSLTEGVPTDAKICGDTEAASILEVDYYRITTTRPGLEVTLTWASAAADLDFVVLDARLQERVLAGYEVGPSPEHNRLSTLPAGTYYIAVNSYEGPATAAIPYELVVTTNTCIDDTECAANAPRCVDGECIAVDACTGDDAAEHGDDSYTVAPVIVPPAAPFTGAICGAEGEPSDPEYDFRRVALAIDEGLIVDLELGAAASGAPRVVAGVFEVDTLDGIAGVEVSSTARRGRFTIPPRTAAGDVLVAVYSEDVPVAAVPYTLGLSVSRPLDAVQGAAISTTCPDPNVQYVNGPFGVRLAGFVSVGRFSVSAGFDGYFLTDGTTDPYSGVLVTIPANPPTSFAVGSFVAATGQHTEFYCNTQLSANLIVPMGVSATLPAPLALANNPSVTLLEQREGMLVEMSNVSVTAVDAAKGQLTTNAGVGIDAFIRGSAWTDSATLVGKTLKKLRGIVRFSFGTYRVSPRAAADIELN